MRYSYRKPDHAYGFWRDDKGNQWKYGKMHGKLVGDTGLNLKTKKYAFLMDGDRKLPIEPPRKRLGFFESIIGYLPCYADSEEGCVRIVKISLRKINVALFLIIALVCVSMYGFYRSVHEATMDEVIYLELPESMHNTDSSGYSIPDYTTIRKNENNDKTDTWLINVNGNPYDLSYEIYLKDGNELLYRSEILSEGEVIQGMTLYKELSAGEYEYSLICKVYNHGSTEEISTQNFDGILEVYK